MVGGGWVRVGIEIIRIEAVLSSAGNKNWGVIGDQHFLHDTFFQSSVQSLQELQLKDMEHIIGKLLFGVP